MSDRAEIRSHLESFGIRHFEDGTYWEWGGKQLGQSRARALDKLRTPLSRGTATEKSYKRFYEYIANERIVSVVASLKTDAISASGLTVLKHLVNRKRILDIGCSTGYLTTWYAIKQPVASIVGIDCVPANISAAGEEAAKRGLHNCSFQVADAATFATSEPFDVIVDTQSLFWKSLRGLRRIEKTLRNLLAQATPNVVFISIPPLGTSLQAQAFMELVLKPLGLGLTQFTWAPYDDLSQRGYYPVFVCEKGKESISVDLDREYEIILKALEGSGQCTRCKQMLES